MPTRSLPDLAPLAGLLVILELAAGTVALSTALEVAGRVGRGYAGTTAALCALMMGVDLLLLSGTSDLGALLHHAVDPPAVATLAHWAIVFTVLLVLDALFAAVGTEASRRVVACLAVAAGLVTLVSAALALGPALGGVAPALLAFLPATLLGGGAMAGMLLGHWYLVTPTLSFRPLRLSIYAVFGAVAVNSLVIALSIAHADAAARDQVISGDQSVLFWLLVVGSGVVFTAAVNALTLYFARMRSNQPATAMFYVLIISVVMAMVPGQLIFFLTGVPV